jgi:hypothetical protein
MLTDIFKRDVSVIRIGAGSYQNFVWVDGGQTSLTIRANVQPTPAEIMLTLPEGYRTKDSFILYTNTQLFTSEDNQNNPDVVLLYGKRFFVTKVEIWQNTILAHYEIVVVKEESDVN